MKTAELYENNRDTLFNLQQELTELSENYSRYLEQEYLSADVECLKKILDSYENGSALAMEMLEQHGHSVITAIKAKLQAAAQDIQRIDEESPQGEHFSGGRMDRLSKAVSLANQAENQLTQLLQDQKSLVH